MEKTFRIVHTCKVNITAENKDRAIEKFYDLLGWAIKDDSWTTTARRIK